MKLMSPLIRFASVATMALLLTVSANAQQDQGDGGGAGAAGGTGGPAIGGAALSTDVDTSAFQDLQRSGEGDGGANNPGGAGGFGGFGGGGFGGGFGGLGNLFGNQGFGNTNQSSTPSIRTRLRSAVNVAPMPQQRVESNANQRFVQMPRQQGISNVGVNVVGRTAILRGAVSSERDRRMSELLMRLEPGVSTIQNEIVVAASTDPNATQQFAPQTQATRSFSPEVVNQPFQQYAPRRSPPQYAPRRAPTQYAPRQSPPQYVPQQNLAPLVDGQVIQGELIQGELIQGGIIQDGVIQNSFPTQP